MSERTTDRLVANLLTSAGIAFDEQKSRIKEIDIALSSSSKHGTGKHGFPEFIAQSGDFIIIIEDKADAADQAKYLNNGTLLRSLRVPFFDSPKRVKSFCTRSFEWLALDG
ncbi:MAG: hypothetical protein IJU19_02555 [Bacteroidales bacterium]|nr:hypothetical protein [Bacteroidales bacterium]